HPRAIASAALSLHDALPISDGWFDRAGDRGGGGGDPGERDGLEHRDLGGHSRHRRRFLGCGRSLLRVLPGAQGGRAESDRGPALRIVGSYIEAEETARSLEGADGGNAALPRPTIQKSTAMKNGVFARGATGTRPRARLARFTLVAGLLAFAVLPASAQEPQAQEQAATPRMITFREAIELALERNPTVRTARNNLRLDEIAVRQEKTSFLPDLRFSTSTSQRYGRNFSQDEGRIINTTT